MKTSFKTSILVLALAPLILLHACSRKGNPEDSVATVNDAHILVKDFQEELRNSPERPASRMFTEVELDARLAVMIDRKLMVQEAVKMGLSNDERFLKTIKTFWEQTLIRELAAIKTKEWSETIKVSDDEVAALYGRMRYKVYVRQAHTPDPVKAEEMKTRMLKGARVRGVRRTGPLYAETIAIDDPLQNAFLMKQGATAIWPEKDGYLILMVTRKDKLVLPPLGTVRAETKRYIFEKKKEAAMEQWLADLKKNSRVEVDSERLKKINKDG